MIETLLPGVREKAEKHLEACRLEGIILRVVSALRTFSEQEAVYAQGRTAPGPPCHHAGERNPRKVGECQAHPFGLKVSNAVPGKSWHNYGRAYDVAIVTFPGDETPKDVWDGPWDRVGELGESVGLEWGGRWPLKKRDRPHFQDRNGMTLAQALEQAKTDGLA
jgi:peptidoglycan L-alanyl-D-glutamate endopeptidase CwlK